MPPLAASCVAALEVGRPALEHDAPATAPRIGPHMRSHPIGGPACRMVWPSPRVGIASTAGITSTSTGSPERIRCTASRVGDFDGCITGDALDQDRQLCITARRRRPIDVRDRHAGTRQLAGKTRQADVYDAER